MKLFSTYNPPARPVVPIEGRIVELRALDRELLAEMQALIADGVTLDKPAPTESREVRALELLKGFLPASQKPKAKTRRPEERLAFIISERAAIERALDLAVIRLNDARLDAMRNFIATSSADWAENTRQLSLAIATIWALCRQREDLRLKAGNPSRPTAAITHRQLLGLGAPGENHSANARKLIEEAVDAGIILPDEIHNILGVPHV